MKSDKVIQCPDLHRFADEHLCQLHVCVTVFVTGRVDVHIEFEELEPATVDLREVGVRFLDYTRHRGNSWVLLSVDEGEGNVSGMVKLCSTAQSEITNCDGSTDCDGSMFSEDAMSESRKETSVNKDAMDARPIPRVKTLMGK